MKDRLYRLEYAKTIADGVVDYLSEYCSKIEIAGSIRRKKQLVGDIEIVCVPKREVIQRDMFSMHKDVLGMPLYDRVKHCDWIEPRRMNEKPQALGERYQALRDVPTGVPIDLFIVLPPAQWGVIMTLRTGSADFSSTLMRKARARNHRCEDGRLIDLKTGKVVITEEERDFFDVLNLAWIEPENRL